MKNDRLEVQVVATQVQEVVSGTVERLEVAVVGPRGPGNLVTYETGNEPSLVGIPDETLLIEYA